MKINIVLLVFVLFSVSSCDTAEPEVDFVGNWIVTSLRVSDCTVETSNANFQSMSAVPCNSGSEEGCIHQAFTFTETEYSSSGSALNNGNLANISATGTYEVENEVAEFCENGQSSCRIGEMTRTGDQLSASNLQFPDDPCKTHITADKI